MLGLRALFLDAGSGAIEPVSPDMIKAVKKNTELPLVVGGGIRTVSEIETALDAGADLIVIGNRIEEDIDFLLDIKTILDTGDKIENLK